MDLKTFFYNYIEAWNTRNHEKLKQFFHETYELKSNPDPFYRMTQKSSTIEEAKKKYTSKLDSFPDLQFHTEEIVTDNKSKISVFGYFTGTHTGEYKGIPGTGKQIKQEAAMLYELKENKIIKVRRIADNLSLYLELAGA